MNSEPDLRNAVYTRYSRWKGWTGCPRLDHFSEQFRQELERGEIRRSSKILEVGFGDGAFLEWAKQEGHSVYGVEVTRELYENARSRGCKVYLGPLIEIYRDLPAPFDAVVAFDLLEHLTKQEILEHLDVFCKILRPDGRVIASFPNGASPFGRIDQHGDLTHMTTLSAELIEQFADIAGFELSKACNSARSYSGGQRKRIFLLKAIAYFLRNVIEILIGYIYFGKRYPLDPNLTVVLRRKQNNNVHN
jgi:2-polyprenyl-3-methyl-5-hydroxy-6-metoxy-1,4-benzoquinol methylase